MKTDTFNGHKVYLQKGEYRNTGTLAVFKNKEDAELYGNVTVILNHTLQLDDMSYGIPKL